MWTRCEKHIQPSETFNLLAYFNMPEIALPNFGQGNFGYPGQSMHPLNDPCNSEIQNHLEKINYHHNVTYNKTNDNFSAKIK